MASIIASKSPVAIYGTKVALHYAREHKTDEGIDYVVSQRISTFN